MPTTNRNNTALGECLLHYWQAVSESVVEGAELGEVGGGDPGQEMAGVVFGHMYRSLHANELAAASFLGAA